MVMQARLLTLVLLICVVGMTAGCLPIPLLPSSNISSYEDDIEELVDKSSTKIEAIEKLGNPMKYSKASMSYTVCGNAAGVGFIVGLGYQGALIDFRSSKCFELVLEFDNNDHLLSYQEKPFLHYQEELRRANLYSSKNDIMFLKLADQGDDSARHLWEQSITYQNKLPSGVNAIQEKGAATEGDAEAQLQLYWNDLTVDMGLKWLCRAADQWNLDARNQLGKLYYYGSQKFYQVVSIQIKPDLPRSCMWFHLGGYGGAEVKNLAFYMAAHELENAERLVLAWEPGQCDLDFKLNMGAEYEERSDLVGLCSAADQNSFSAREELGRIYNVGSNGVEQDLSRAYMWYHLAAQIYAPSDMAGGTIQSWCNTMTTEQHRVSGQLLADWQPGQCERDLVPNNTGN